LLFFFGGWKVDFTVLSVMDYLLSSFRINENILKEAFMVYYLGICLEEPS
jgi:hypothetical protein